VSRGKPPAVLAWPTHPVSHYPGARHLVSDAANRSVCEGWRSSIEKRKTITTEGIDTSLTSDIIIIEVQS